jgi:hypothetical protein
MPPQQTNHPQLTTRARSWQSAGYRDFCGLQKMLLKITVFHTRLNTMTLQQL